MLFQVVLTILQALSPNPAADENACVAAGSTEPARISSIAVRPPTDRSKGGNAILDITFASKPNRRFLTMTKGTERLVAKDDGLYPDREAGDGTFSALANLAEAPTGLVRESFVGNEGAVALFKWKIKFKVVPCPPNCRTPLGGTCWFCIEVSEGEIGN